MKITLTLIACIQKEMQKSWINVQRQNKLNIVCKGMASAIWKHHNRNACCIFFPQFPHFFQTLNKSTLRFIFIRPHWIFYTSLHTDLSRLLPGVFFREKNHEWFSLCAFQLRVNFHPRFVVLLHARLTTQMHSLRWSSNPWNISSTRLLLFNTLLLMKHFSVKRLWQHNGVNTTVFFFTLNFRLTPFCWGWSQEKVCDVSVVTSLDWCRGTCQRALQSSGAGAPSSARGEIQKK